MSRKPPPFFNFAVLHQTYTTNFTMDYYNTLPRINHIRRYEKNIIHETHTTKTTRDHKDDGIMETERDFEEDCEEEESLFEDIVCYIL